MDLVISITELKDGNANVKKGLCTSYLSEVNIGEDLALFHHPESVFSTRIRLGFTTPLIMICNGSGIAPFRGIWQTESNFDPLQSLLIFGCRDEKENFFEDETEKIGLRRITAFSRSSNNAKMHVQDVTKTKEVSEEIANLVVDRKGSIFVCGSVS